MEASESSGSSNTERYMEAMMQRMSHLASVAMRTDPATRSTSQGGSRGVGGSGSGAVSSSASRTAVGGGIPSQYAGDVLDVEETTGGAAAAGSTASGGIEMSEEAIETLMDMMAFSRSEARALLIRHNGVLADVLNMLFS